MQRRVNKLTDKLDAEIRAAGFHGYHGCECPTPFHCSERGDCLAVKCVYGNCPNDRVKGQWCGDCWDRLWERDVAIQRDSADAQGLAEEVVKLRRTVDFLVDLYEIRGLCDCGHLARVHHHGGCSGLKPVGFSEWGTDYAPCRCGQYQERGA